MNLTFIFSLLVTAPPFNFGNGSNINSIKTTGSIESNLKL